MSDLQRLPELRSWDSPAALIRIPDQTDVPLTDRVSRLVDSAAFRRLAEIRQLGFVSLVYPGAQHTRFEHSLGVYRNALMYLRQLSHDAEFCRQVDAHTAEVFLVAALLHDLGHWPYCHPLEDLKLPGVPAHEELALEYLNTERIRQLLQSDWKIRPAEVGNLLSGKFDSAGLRIAGSMLSGPIDVDKMDYLVRDSLHSGVPYGRNFDSQRLISSLCLNRAGDTIGITTKGRTAAELMVFARYVMFSEVYWHHAVRSATAMFQRAFFELRETLPLASLLRGVEGNFVSQMIAAAKSEALIDLTAGLFGPERRLYKRWAQFNYFERPAIYSRMARQPYANLVRVAEVLAGLIGKSLGTALRKTDILLDAPPPGLEVQFEIDVWDPKRGEHRPLGVISPVVQSLARVQFDDYVKQVRLFLHPRLSGMAGGIDAEPYLLEALDRAGL